MNAIGQDIPNGDDRADDAAAGCAADARSLMIWTDAKDAADKGLEKLVQAPSVTALAYLTIDPAEERELDGHVTQARDHLAGLVDDNKEAARDWKREVAAHDPALAAAVLDGMPPGTLRPRGFVVCLSDLPSIVRICPRMPARTACPSTGR